MLEFNANFIEFCNMGLFSTEDIWKHPDNSIKTYEIIYVVEGEIHIYEEEKKYDLKKGQLLIFHPDKIHGGTQNSTGKTVFYWLHFYCGNFDFFILPDFFEKDLSYQIGYFFKELIHYGTLNNQLKADCLLLDLILVLQEQKNLLKNHSIINEIAEWIRINSDIKINLSDISEKYSYNCDYISKGFKKIYGKNIKMYINEQRIKYIKNYLSNTCFSIKEIANLCNFNDENHFIKFFIYNACMTPTDYRNKFFSIHMNKR